MSEPKGRQVEHVLRTYFRAKDENRQRLMREAFSETATLENFVKTSAIAFPPVSQGLAPISDVLIRKFAQTCENACSFCLELPPLDVPAGNFSCDWLVGMSEKEGGSARVGCGRCDWRFRTAEPRLADRLVITFEAMQVLSADRMDAALQWLTGLPCPWCPPRRPLETAPAIPELYPVLRYVGRQKPV